MRVAIVTESFLPQVNGVTNSVLRVLEQLRHRGHDVLLVAPGAGPDEHEGTRVVRVRAVDIPMIASLPVGLPTGRISAALRGFRPDVVHLAAPFVVGARALLAARRLGIPRVAVYQTDVAGFASSYGLGIAERTAWRWAKYLHGMADRTLAPSSAAARALREHGIPRVHRWGRGVDTDLFSPSRRDAALRAQLVPGGELLVGYVGRLAPEKKVHRLAALHDMPGVRLVIVGDGPETGRLRKSLPRAAFLGFRSGAELAAAYASLDVFVHTGPHETFCQAVQEALACGVPVLAPDAGGPRDLVRPGSTGFLLPAHDDTEHGIALREAVSELACARVRAEFSAAARSFVRTRTWPAVCDELLNHYAEVTGLSKGGRRAA